MAKGKRRRSFGSIIQRPPRPGFYVRFTWNGERIKRSAGTTRKAARSKLAAAESLLTAGVALPEVLAEVFGDFHGSRLTFRDAAPHYLSYAAGRKKVSTLVADTRRMRRLLTAPWAGKVLARIRTEDFLPWIASRQKAREVVRKERVRGTDGKTRTKAVKKTAPGASGATINRDLALASALFKWAIQAGYVEENPVRRVERFDEKGGARETFLTPAESGALVDSCSPLLRPLVLAALHTGMRRGELLSLAWSAVDLERREVYVCPADDKVGDGRAVPLTDALCGALRALKAERKRPALDESDPVFTDNDGGALSPWSMRKMFEATVARCRGIPLAKRKALRFHDLRHTYASTAVASGVSIFDVAKLLGHRNIKTTMRYAHFQPEAGRDAADRVGRAFSTVLESSRTGS